MAEKKAKREKLRAEMEAKKALKEQ